MTLESQMTSYVVYKPHEERDHGIFIVLYPGLRTRLSTQRMLSEYLLNKLVDKWTQIPLTLSPEALRTKYRR